jgi:HEAT repeat protein
MSPTPESVQQLLNSNDLGDRLRAVNQLRELDPAIAFVLVQVACQDTNPRLRYAAVSQMDTLGHQNPPKALEILRDALHHDPETDVKAAAADALGGLKLTEAFTDLQAAYESTDEWLLQFSIIASLGEMGDTRAFDLLASALASPVSLVVTAAIGSLGELGDTRAIPLLIPFVDHADWQVRHRVIQALSAFDTPEVRTVLEGLRQDPDAIVAETAKRHLEQ